MRGCVRGCHGAAGRPCQHAGAVIGQQGLRGRWPGQDLAFKYALGQWARGRFLLWIAIGQRRGRIDKQLRDPSRAVDRVEVWGIGWDPHDSGGATTLSCLQCFALTHCHPFLVFAQPRPDMPGTGADSRSPRNDRQPLADYDGCHVARRWAINTLSVSGGGRLERAPFYAVAPRGLAATSVTMCVRRFLAGSSWCH